MLTRLENLPAYSTDIWDYLVDMPYMPSRQDRDNLVKEMEGDASKNKRVQLWDYFFRIRPEDVGIRQRKEVADLERAIVNAQQQLSEQKSKLERVQNEFERQKWDREKQVAEHLARLVNIGKRNRILGIIIILAGFLFLALSALSVSIYLLDPNDGFYLFLFVFFVCCGLPLAGIGTWLLISSRQPSDKKIEREIAKFLGPRTRTFTRDVDFIANQITSLESAFDSFQPQHEQRIRFLRAQIDDLISQIPIPPSDEQVDMWLKEDTQYLSTIATSRSGLQDRLIKVLNAENPFCIRGPAELQLNELIPAPYRDKKSGRYKNLQARRFTIMPDGTFADFYGVYNIEFILVADDVLATYGTFYDFITGRQSGERTTGQHYADVVSIKTLKGYREVELDNGEKVTMENVPSLSMTLTSSDKIDITFPDEDYFKQTNAQGFRSARWRFDPRIAADNAIKVLREKVDAAKKKREINN